MTDARHLLSRPFAPIEQAYKQHDTQLYALGADPLDGGPLPYAYEGVDGKSLKALSTFANILAYPGCWAREPDTGMDWHPIVHAEQQIVLHVPLPASACVSGQNRVAALWDKGAAMGDLVPQREVRDAASQALPATVTLLRGDGGFGEGGSDGALPAPHAIPDAVCDRPTLPQTALIYRLSGDYTRCAPITRSRLGPGSSSRSCTAWRRWASPRTWCCILCSTTAPHALQRCAFASPQLRCPATRSAPNSGLTALSFRCARRLSNVTLSC